VLGEVLGDLRQLRAFATLLESIARDTARPAWERAWAIRLRGPLPGGADVLGRLVHRPGSDGPEAVTVVEAALLDMCRDRPDRSTDDTRRALAEIAVAHAVDWTRPEATHDDLRGVAARRVRGDARDVVIDPE
jgi:hypothetical protein